MFRKTIGIAVAMLTVAVSVAALVTSAPGGAARRTYTIAFVEDGDSSYLAGPTARGGRAAATGLGVRFIYVHANSAPGYKSLIARHVDAIATNGYDPSQTPLLNKVRAAGIELLSLGDDIAARRALWVSGSDPVAYAEALADTLASQMKGEGEYAILGQQGQYPIANQWERLVERYVARAYPRMKLVGVVTGTGAGDPAEVASVEGFIRAHPKLRGLVGIAPTEGYMAAGAIRAAGDIGKVFSAGNGGLPPLDRDQVGFVQSGAAELVYTYNPFKLGYLTVWAAHYLLTGHSFKPGLYHVGGSIGNVWYHAPHQELRLGQPLTITKANVDQFAF